MLRIIFLIFIVSTDSAANFVSASPYIFAQEETGDKKQENVDKKAPEKEEDEESGTAVPKPPKAKRANRSEIDIIAPPSLIEQQEGDLQHYLTPEVISPVLVGTQEHQTLVVENQSSNSKGVMIFLPDWQQQAINPKAINFLRNELPNQGWTSISIQPLMPPENYPSHAIKALEREEQDKEALDSYQTNLSELMTKVIEKAKSYPGIIVIVAQGQNGALLPILFEQEEIEAPMAYIMLSAFMITPKSIKASANATAEIAFPVLDLALKTDSRLVMQNQKQRQTKVNQYFKSGYRQDQIFNMYVGYYPEQTLLKEITGWLKINGW